MWLYFGQDLSSEFFVQMPHTLNYPSVQQLSRYQLPGLHIPWIPPQPCPDLGSYSVPISAFPARRLEGFLVVSPRRVRARSACTSMVSIPSKISIWHSEPEITELWLKQLIYFWWCIAKKAVLSFRPEVHWSSSFSAKCHFRGCIAPAGKWLERIKKDTHCPVPGQFSYRSQILTWSYIGNRSASEVTRAAQLVGINNEWMVWMITRTCKINFSSCIIMNWHISMVFHTLSQKWLWHL